VYAHAENNPIWQNTDPSKWFSDHWELAKCYLGTTGYQNRCSAFETDVTGLLTIVINDLALHDAIDNLNNFVEVSCHELGEFDNEYEMSDYSKQKSLFFKLVFISKMTISSILDKILRNEKTSNIK
jgi:hypothetical protein